MHPARIIRFQKQRPHGYHSVYVTFNVMNNGNYVVSMSAGTVMIGFLPAA